MYRKGREADVMPLVCIKGGICEDDVLMTELHESAASSQQMAVQGPQPNARRSGGGSLVF
jgi:hypothetical protein